MKKQESRPMGCIVLWLFWLVCFLAVFSVIDTAEAWIALLGFIIQSFSLIIFVWLRSRIAYRAVWQRWVSLWLTFFVPQIFVALSLSRLYGVSRLLITLLFLILSVVVTVGSHIASRLFSWNIWLIEE